MPKTLGRYSGSMDIVKPLLLCSLLIQLGSCYGTESSDHKNTHRVDIRIEQVDSHMHHHTDPAAIVFFLLEDLKPGNTMPVYFPNRALSDSLTKLLPKEEADSIPFSSQHLDYLTHRFSFAKDSPQAIAMRDTLNECDRNPIKGETKFCATSMESMSVFLHNIFGSHSQIEPLSTTHIKRSDGALLQKYTIMGIQQIPAPKMVSCHTMPYAYTVFYCHYQASENRVYRVSLLGENSDTVEAIAVCHMDTSQWGHKHVAFEVLGVEPGSSPICHFFPEDNFVWVPSVTQK